MIVGDVEVDNVARGMRCEACGRRDYLAVKGWFPSAEERVTCRELLVRARL
jgi:hypothetical protein